MSVRRPSHAAASRARAEPGFRVCVAGVTGTSEDVGLLEDDEREAVMTAFSVCTPFGHSLWRDGRFLGWFEPGDGRLVHIPDPASAAVAATGPVRR